MSTPTNKQVNIYINQASAERALENLQKKAAKLTTSLEATRKQGEDLTKNLEKLGQTNDQIEALTKSASDLAGEIDEGKKAGKDMTAEMVNLGKTSAAIEQLSKKAERLTTSIEKGKTAAADAAKKVEELGKTQSKIDDLTKQINSGLSPSFNQVKARVLQLKKEIEGMSKEAPEYAAKFEEFSKVSTVFNQMAAEIKSVGDALDDTDEKSESFFDKVKAIALGTIIGNTVQAAMEKVGGYFSGIISGNAALSDSLSDVRKATGLSDEEVKKLNSSLGKIDTRTPTEELRKIAVGLGQIGEMATPEAVASIDKIVVALGDEFGGGAQEITTTLGVLRNNLQDIKSKDYGEDVLRIGNALNVLGAEGLATAPVVVDFANRMAGIAGTFKVSSGQILGLAAAMQELGIPAERGSTAVTKLLQKIAGETDKYARVAKFAGVSGKEFANLVNTDIITALTKVAEGARKAGADNQTFGKILADLDADGSGAGEVLSKLATNAELVTGKITLAGKALKDTSSITGEFDLKNNNMAAQLIKLEKAFSKLITSPAVNNFVQSAVDVAVVFVKVLGDVFTFVGKNTLGFGLWGAAILLQTSAVSNLVKWAGALLLNLKGMTAQQVLSTIAFRADTIATSLAAAAKALFARNVALARKEWQLATAAMGGFNPLTAILLVAGALAIALNVLINKTKELTAAQRVQDELAKRVTDDTADTISKISVLTSSINNQKLSLDQRKTALEELIKISPDYLKGLTLENIATSEGKKILDDYVIALRRKAEEEALASYRSEQLKRKFDAERNAKRADKQSTKFKVAGLQFEMGGGDWEKYSKDYQEATENIAEVDRVIKENLERQAKEALAPPPTPTKPSGYKSAEDEKKAADAAKKAEALRKREEEALIHWKEKFEQLQADVEALGISQDEREIQRVKDKYVKLEQEAEAYFREFNKHIADAAGLTALQTKELDILYKKQFNDRSDNEYKDSLQKSENYYNEKKQQAAVDRANGILTHEDYARKIVDLDHEEAVTRAIIAQDYADTSKKAAKDSEEAKTKAVQDGIKKREDAERRSAQEKVDGAQLKVLTAPRGSDLELKAKEDLLRAQFELETQYMDKTSAAYKSREAQLNRELADMDRQHMLQKVNTALEILSQLTAIAAQYVAMLNQKDTQELDSDRSKNDKVKKNLQKRLDSGQISRAAYDKKIEKLDEQYDKKEKEVKLKQFKRNKAISLVQAVINTAQAVTAALTAGPVVGIVLAALAGALGAVQIGMIASQKAPEYGKGRRPQGDGGVPDGPSHANDGIKLVNSQTGEVVGVMEGNEPILSVATYQNNKDIVDQLLDASMNGGGRRIAQPSYLYSRPPGLNTGKVTETMQYVSLYRNGGMLQQNSGTGTSGQAINSGQPFPADAMMAILEKLSAQLDEGISASVAWTDMDDKNKTHDLLRKTAGFNAFS